MTVSDYEQRVLNCVEEYGWFGLSVGSGGEHEPGFTYSVGFVETLKCPEFIVFGLPAKLSHAMLWEVFRQIRDGVSPQDGQRWSDVLDEYECVSRAVHPSQIVREHFNSALWYARHAGRPADSLQAFQLFWPGVEQRLFPWENGCDRSVVDAQPALYLPRNVGLA